jgi:hypothetical protein
MPGRPPLSRWGKSASVCADAGADAFGDVFGDASGDTFGDSRCSARRSSSAVGKFTRVVLFPWRAPCAASPRSLRAPAS